MPRSVEGRSMPIRRIVTAATLLAGSLAFGATQEQGSVPPETAGVATQATAAPEELGSAALQLVAAEAPPQNPCDDYNNLEQGKGHPVYQDWFNHLDERGYARFVMACVYHWGGDQFACLDELWGKYESGWNRLADNPHSSAFGIWQGMEDTRKHYMTIAYQTTDGRLQVRLGGLPYVHNRHHTPCEALNYRLSNGYY